MAVFVAAGVPGSLPAAEELTIAYLKHDIQEANVAIMEAWAKAKGIRLIKVPLSYPVYDGRIGKLLESGDDLFDVVWHNDDWGQLWADWVEPVDDVVGMDQVAEMPLEPFINAEGKVTAVPMTHTVGAFFYRSDLVPAEEVPTTFEQLVTVSKRLQSEGKVKWGYVGGMKMNHTWFTQWWSMWSNNCDVFQPIYERDNHVLETAGWIPAIAEPCHQEVIEFWWDAIHAHRISPEDMTSYGREEANAIFTAGDAAFTLVDSTYWGTFNDPNTSAVAGLVGMARFPIGPRRDSPIAWNEIWGWAIPKGVSEEHKALAKEMLGAMLTDINGQIVQWEKTGGPPPNRAAWDQLAARDTVFEQLKHAVLDVEPPTHAAYYFPNWPAVHKVYSDVAIQALTGARDDVARVLQAGASRIHDAAVQ